MEEPGKHKHHPAEKLRKTKELYSAATHDLARNKVNRIPIW